MGRCVGVQLHSCTGDISNRCRNQGATSHQTNEPTEACRQQSPNRSPNLRRPRLLADRQRSAMVAAHSPEDRCPQDRKEGEASSTTSTQQRILTSKSRTYCRLRRRPPLPPTVPTSEHPRHPYPDRHPVQRHYSSPCCSREINSSQNASKRPQGRFGSSSGRNSGKETTGGGIA